MKRYASISTFTALSICCLWILGNGLSDRWGWSQWLAWIPTLLVIACIVLAVIIAAVARSNRQLKVLILTCVAIACGFVFVENRFVYLHHDSGNLKIIGWTMSHSKKLVSRKSAIEIVRLDADITVLTHGWHVRGESVIKEWLGDDGRKLISGQFTVFTKLQVLEVRTLIASNGIFISLFILDATHILGRPITLWAIDFPSSLSKSRMAIASRAKRLLQEVDAPPPDIVIGDFNMTRNSAAIKTLFPTLHDASNDGGTGWLASYPMSFPLYHIDHILLNEQLHATTYKLINPHTGRHRIQIAEIKKVD